MALPQPRTVLLLRTATVAAVLAQLAVALDGPAADRFADLQVYVGAASSWGQGHSFYDYQRANGDVFTYPPAAGFLLSWTAVVPLLTLQALWLALELGASAVLARVAGASPVQRALLLLLLVSLTPGRSTVAFGQVSVLVVALVVVDLLVVPPRYRGLLTGLAVAVKLTPVLFVALLLVGGRRRAAARAGAAAAGVSLLALAADPAESARYWLHELPGTSRFVDLASPGNQSLRAALVRLGVAHADAVWLLLSSVVCTVALVAGRRLLHRGEVLHALVVVGAASLVASPVSWTHHQYWLVLAALVPRRRLVGALVVAVMAVPPLPGPVGRESHLLLALAVVAAGCRRRVDRAPSPSPADVTRTAHGLT